MIYIILDRMKNKAGLNIHLLRVYAYYYDVKI